MQIQRHEDLGVELRTIMLNGQPLISAEDLATALGYKRTNNLTQLLPNHTIINVSRKDLGLTPGSPVRYITESGFYYAAMRSNVPKAVEFQRWLAEDVVPSLRRDGYVIAPTATPAQIQRMAERIAYMQIEDMIAGSFDYSSGSEQTRELFSFIQNLIHRTITGQTAKELCSSREIVTWKGKNGPTKADLAIGKNYLTPSEAQRMKGLDAMVIGVVKSLIDENGKYTLDEVRSAVIKGVEVYKSLRS